MKSADRWRMSLLVILLVVVVAFAAACGAGEEDAAEPEESEGEEPAEEAPEDVRGGTLRIGWSRTSDGMDPAVWTSRFDRFFMTQIYTPLIFEPEPYEYEPGLAEDWEISDDWSEITFYLRDDIDLTDGTHWDANVVIENWDRINDPDTGSLQTRQFENIESYEAVDDYTVRVKWDGPNKRIINHFTNELWPSPNSPKAIEEMGEADYTLTPVSYGPYKIEEWEGETKWIFVRNEDYEPFPHEDTEGPFIEKIEVNVIPEATPRLAALEGGDVDVIFDPGYHEVQALKDDPGFQVADYGGAGLVQGYFPNTRSEPMDEKNVRLALQYGHDPDEMCDIAFFNAQPPAYAPCPSGCWSHPEDARERWGYDPEKAEELLDEAGWTMDEEEGWRTKDGEVLHVRLVASDDTHHEVAVEQWQEIGIKAELLAMEYEATVSRIADDDQELSRLGLSGDDPHTLWSAFHSSQIEGGAQFNRSKVADDKLDEMLDKGTDIEDFEERREHYIEIQEYIMENGYMIPSFETVYIWAMSDKLEGWEFDTTGNPLMHKMWLED